MTVLQIIGLVIAAIFVLSALIVTLWIAGTPLDEEQEKILNDALQKRNQGAKQ